MARSSRRLQLPSLVLLLFFALLPLLAQAQLSSVPDLSTATETSADTTTSPTGRTTQQTQQTTGRNTQTDNSQSSAFQLTGAPQLSTSNGNALATATNKLGTSAAVHLTGLPTIAGAGIPDLVIPYTAGAPFMQKSSLPEGTFFIAVGATLAFCGACVLLWRLMVAWSINRSVKRTAMLASAYGGSEKAGRTTSSYWGGSTAGYNRMASSGGGKAGGFYKDSHYDSTVTLDTLTASGKPLKPPHFRDSVAERSSPSSNLPANLFFSPTAQAASQRDSGHIQPSQHRNSGYMPSGYYASPSSQAAGGNSAIAIGGNLAPGSYGNPNRHSAIALHNNNPSPPLSPSLPPQSRGTNVRYSTQSRDSYAQPASRDGLRAPQSRDGLASARSSTAFLGAMPSSSSLGVAGASGSEAGTVSRAPSAYLEELFDNHGSGPRERY